MHKKKLLASFLYIIFFYGSFKGSGIDFLHCVLLVWGNGGCIVLKRAILCCALAAQRQKEVSISNLKYLKKKVEKCYSKRRTAGISFGIWGDIQGGLRALNI